ncbi:MAG: hypothetical protein PHP25_04045 [Candidatus Moranbacteria bacterium]|nr:hypothetical protein [Candidatus Moranbacteria bacterium]
MPDSVYLFLRLRLGVIDYEKAVENGPDEDGKIQKPNDIVKNKHTRACKCSKKKCVWEAKRLARNLLREKLRSLSFGANELVSLSVITKIMAKKGILRKP